MSIKHGAIMGLAMAIMAMVGVVGNQPGESLSTEAAGLSSETPERIVAVDAAESSAALPEPIVLVSAEPEEVLLSTRGQAKQVSCDDLVFDIGTDPDPAETTPGGTIGFYHQVRYANGGALAPVTHVQWYLSNPLLSDDDTYTHDEQVAIGDVNYPEYTIYNWTYADAGSYDVGIRVYINGEWCPSTDDPPQIFSEYVLVSSKPSASFESYDMIVDEQAVVPLAPYQTLFAFTMSYPESDYAPRTLTRLRFLVKEDPVSADDRPFDRGYGLLEESSFYEWALFRDNGEDGPDQVLVLDQNEPYHDEFITRWDAHGFPYEAQDSAGNYTTISGLRYSINDLIYDLSFTYDSEQGTTNPSDPTDSDNPTRSFSEWVTAAQDPGAGYIVAFIPSASWTSGVTVSYQILERVMQPYYGEGAAIGEPNYEDSYPEDLLDPKTTYSSAFNVFDIRGAEVHGYDHVNQNIWNSPNFMYTPVSDFTRPRWDLTGSLVNSVFGELMDIRQLCSAETWVPLLGLDLHGSSDAQPREINLIFTDVDGDPYKRPGNGGFEPKEGLERMTLLGFEEVDNPENAVGQHYAYNGAWLYHDTNDNGLFDVPVGGNFGPGDYPMRPGGFPLDFEEEQLAEGTAPEWEYIPFPPTGGDPWWKIRLTFSDGRMRAEGATPTGNFEAVPDRFEEGVLKPDYFVVMRPDSGYGDVSGQTGDGVGIDYGADTRVFIEPRRWQLKGEYGPHYDGGILISDQIISPQSELYNWFHIARNVGSPVYWQDDLYNDAVCHSVQAPCPYSGDDLADYENVVPWWSERFHSQDNVKAVRFGFEVHDLVMTYSSNNRYQKITPIMPGQSMWRFFYTPEQTLSSAGRTGFSLWNDPGLFPYDTNGDNVIDLDEYFGIIESRFFRLMDESVDGLRYNTGVIPDLAEDLFDSIQYSRLYTHYPFETVPFAMGPDALDPTLSEQRSNIYTHPADQPTLPRYSQWPNASEFPLAAGFSCRVYLASEGEISNETYSPPSSSNSWASYADDVYICVLDDLSTSLPQGAVSAEHPIWLINELGGRFQVSSINNNELTLVNGHGAYPELDSLLEYPDYPFGITVGPNAAIAHGLWAVTENSLRRNNYTRIDDWPVGLDRPVLNGADMGVRAARLLTQELSQNSLPTAMIGINLTGLDDSVVNAATKVSLDSLTVAFWGPEFEPSDLSNLDPSGTSFLSGVNLYEDTNNSGAYEGLFYVDTVVDPDEFDLEEDDIVPLEPNSLAWSSDGAEPIDLDGDLIPDDLSGDGVVTATGLTSLATGESLSAEEISRWDGLSDLAWVLRLRPAEKWEVPNTDIPDYDLGSFSKSATSSKSSEAWPEFWTATPALLDPEKAASKAAKALGTNSNGDDLFVVVRSSSNVSAFEQFRCLVPATLPARSPEPETQAGVEISPATLNVSKKFSKRNAEEAPVQDFYGHDMLAVSVPAKINDLTPNLISSSIDGLDLTGAPTILPGSGPVAILGLDLSVNRPENLIASGEGSQAQATENTFIPRPSDVNLSDPESSQYYADNSFTDAVVGCYLIGMSQGEEQDSRLEGYEIIGINGLTFEFRAGAPKNGSPWYLIKDPTFLEQVVVELHDTDGDGAFDPQKDLMPFDMEDPANGFTSGVSLYRDNDLHPSNTNGVFDAPVRDSAGTIEYIDLPVRLDDPPSFIGTLAGEPEYQVRFVFSSPGTDDYTGPDEVAYEDQPRLRQWIPQEFGDGINNPNFGDDFFFVVRTSRDMSLGDDFNAAIVSWGPDTPSEPDPDTFSPLDVRNEEFDLFNEFPWGSRGLGFITMFQEPIPRYFWGYDKTERKVVARKELDHSQDDLKIRNWLRSSPNLALQSYPVTSLEVPEVDFSADPTRQEIDEEVAFTLISTIAIVSIEWDFGDGTTSNERDPEHAYSAAGEYTVSVSVTDQYGNVIVVSKVQYITILEAPFADFEATPLMGVITPKTNANPSLEVSFTDASVGTASYVASSFFWDFGDGNTSSEQNPVHQYEVEGFYTVTEEVTFVNAETSDELFRSCRKDSYITVLPCVGCTGGATDEEESSAKITFTSEVRDKESLVPLTDWAPLFSMNMSYSEDIYSPRVLRTLTYSVRPDQRDPDDLNYGNLSGPDVTDILEFGLFLEQESSDDEDNNNLDEFYDVLLYTWDAYGGSIGELISSNQYSGLVYELDFIGDGSPEDPEFPVINAVASDGDKIEGYNYILAVRTSATWRSQLTMGCTVTNAEMILPTTGVFPLDEEGEPLDTYEPNFFETGEDNTFEPEEAYSSSFTVWDRSGSTSGVSAPGFYDTWNRPMFLYTPLAEHSRPRWSKSDQLLDLMAGEFLQIRQLLSTDSWANVIGINVQSTKAVHAGSFFSALRYDSSKDAVQLREVNVVFTDIGADPFGTPGNGGFNPNDGLKPVTSALWGSPIQEEEALGNDVTYNGVWVWHDSNNNGVFDAPTPNEAGGISYNGDYPMIPDGDYSDIYEDDLSTTEWEYIALPPGGGDPWWQISLRFFEGRRRNLASIIDENNVEGFLEKSPDNVVSAYSGSEYTDDYFVVIRTDSGFKDVSGLSGDGTGITLGADFKVFIEPRRTNPLGHASGGIYVDSMIPPLEYISGSSILYWQDDENWGTEEPWWPERTTNAATAKPMRVGLDVHDLVLTYESDSQYRRSSDLFFGGGTLTGVGCLGYSEPGGANTDFMRWIDPFQLSQSRFLNGHSPGVTVFRLYGVESFTISGEYSVQLVYDDTLSSGQYSFETAPFDMSSLGGVDTRSPAYPMPLDQPVLPSYANWSGEIGLGELARLSDWDSEYVGARMLTQKVDNDSPHTPMLGINIASSSDPFVIEGRETPSVAQITVAFWGPSFTPDDLSPLDSEGRDYDSGVLLWQDSDQNGVFLSPKAIENYVDTPISSSGFDTTVPLRELAWSSAAEPIDLDGDGVADDMNGDGVVDERDNAWVLSFYPEENWELPTEDSYEIEVPFSYVLECGALNLSGSDKRADLSHEPITIPLAKTAEKQDDEDDDTSLVSEQPGDDLFITVRTSDTISRFEGFRAVVPATLPARADSLQKAGIQFYPQVNTSPSAYMKVSPDEDPVQDFYGHDMLEVNVPVRILDVTNQVQSIYIGGAAVPVLALDISTNTEDSIVTEGDGGVGNGNAFTVMGAGWTPDALIGDFLLDENYEAYEIVGNTEETLMLLSGEPRDGSWIIVTSPTFLEQVILELYNEGDSLNFNPLLDLLPLDEDQAVSGIAIYRDNDMDSRARNGVFDPEYDIPLALDAAPHFIGQTGEETQVKFVFSSPGTDNLPLVMEEQARNRQWVPNSFGERATNPYYGADFYIVVRASQYMQEGDNFRVGIVSWGANTPSEPDPDTWARLDGEERNEFALFQEFPWGDRGLGFITFFKEAPEQYFLDGYRAGKRADNSGLNWLRSSSSKKRRTGVYEAIERAVQPDSVVIDSVSSSELPAQILDGETYSLVIRGSGFGEEPVVVLSGYTVEITGANDTAITIALTTTPGVVPVDPVVLIVRNPETVEEISRSDLFTVVSSPQTGTPVISAISPDKGDSSVFPITITGKNFAAKGAVDVYFENTLMAVLDVNAEGSEILVGYPSGGLPGNGLLDVTVRNTAKNAQDTLLDGFEYENSAYRPKLGAWLGCSGSEGGAGGTAGVPGDALVMFLMAAFLFFAMRWGLRSELKNEKD